MFLFGFDLIGLMIGLELLIFWVLAYCVMFDCVSVLGLGSVNWVFFSF